MTPRLRVAWTQAEIQTLRDHASEGARAISARAGRAPSTVRWKASELGISLRRKKPAREEAPSDGTMGPGGGTKDAPNETLGPLPETVKPSVVIPERFVSVLSELGEGWLIYDRSRSVFVATAYDDKSATTIADSLNLYIPVLTYSQGAGQ